MDLLSYPLRLAPNGSAVTVNQGSDEANAELVAVLVNTHLGERPLVPTFGIPDPAFATLDISDVVGGVEQFGPDVTIDAVALRSPDATSLEVEIAFS